jgi:hypothetical protein
MSSPAIVKVTGTSIGYWVCDWTQVPFNVSCAAIVSGATGTFTVDVTWDDISGVDVNAVGTAGSGTSNATWFTVVALGAANVTANFTTPVQAFRVNMQTAGPTSVVTVTFLQGLRGLP